MTDTQKRPYKKTKTRFTELTKHEVDKVYEGLNKFLADNFDGLHIPFPSDEHKDRIAMTPKSNAKLPDYPVDPYEGQETGTF